ncbi:aminomethyl-transferring glycine dehydrogenase subunit GcvPB [Desulfosporosinus meridiei]|uniref:Probable glycine dehydrogenase (decarboxylating) subunit 2 n=1 Tax=Desulfosporosinus meridiei (strain ATCC BAA-275 / DSM 13257 / KCTC 12902 / NCIMB 13706 / S10) TaxID=768704 RepID=J7J2X9_DESMD|nr:aminomethyl-transferring glycine dehydrogenase subunit GcvPB [Desulfosporosinus meridiei]AFQ45658.1 glycine cleavage system protein P [Desulfosporosinus meridiei DSM 13257]
MKVLEPLIFDLSADGRTAVSLPACDVAEVPIENLIPESLLRKQEPLLPEVSEVDAVRHFTHLSTFNHGVDTGFYPLGSCTMKYNPKVNEMLSRLPGFTALHPYQPESLTQGALQLMAELQEDLCELTGMDGFTLQPAAGAHGEMTGILIIKAYHDHRQDTKRSKVVVPDSAHGTNPATAAMAGYEIIQIPSNERGGVDLEALKEVLNDEVAALMLTNPNTVGLFDENILEITKLVHDVGGLLYYDGANTNAVMGIARPGDMGFDVVHLNLHKTFSTPHGGGGPGSGPVGVKEFLIPYLPKPLVVRSEDGVFTLKNDMPLSIGRVRSFYANFSVLVRAYAYIRSLGGAGLRSASENAVLNANYLMSILKDHYYLPFERVCMHEFIITPKNLKSTGVHTLDIAKRLLDYGYHPPTIYFPIIVEEAMMIEPTETESIETLDKFAEVLIKIAEEARNDSDLVKNAPYTTFVTRLDEVSAVRKPNLRWRKES